MTQALSTSAAHPLYLYVVFAVCLLGALALLLGGLLTQRRSSWPRHMRSAQTPTVYPAEPAPVREPTPEPKPEAPVAKKATPRKTAAKKTATPAAKKTTAKKTTPRKTTSAQ
jgi:hypothetical protein